VLVVDDSLTVRRRLVETLAADPAIQVVAEAEDGKRAIELCQQLRPDVVTLDMVLPVLSGLAATEFIMAYCPTPIVIVSASLNRKDVFKTYDALAAGALDVLEKPNGDEAPGEWERKLIAQVKVASRIKVITHPRARLGAMGRRHDAVRAEPAGRAGCPRLVAIGGSTGAPGAIVDVLGALSERFPLPILLVIHIGEPFGIALADWLASQSPLPVTCATDGEPLPPPGQARVLVAPPSRHLVLRDGRLRLTADAERHSCRPSVDVLFESVARELGGDGIGCLLTGMGRDGAAGLLAIKRAGGLTLAQDESTSVVFGMPREAILLGAADRVLPLDQIGPTLTALADGAPPQGRP
jgi:two-component system chemotaxis response regulator CheB